ncbi:WD repeat-containing protein 7 isoform X1 [Coffea eugenioides]|uniref:WD repeat-containing protein 7 isoform X1 n=1 Tax=Coffea eugenioides TaxID=49369 RepID=UPI000F61162E|nr:WD repeat-containing protein 7 isoform X1 [Coffea eugenioides]
MKCRSVACIWSASPPTHKVTATAVLNHPPTLYTGGSDGSIIWWTLPSSCTYPNQEMEAIAMLCGHTAPISDLAICFPTAVSGNGKLDHSSDFVSDSSSNVFGALISVCKDGVLCVWSRASGHCRRRRKMPPWVGSPSKIQSLPENKRYVCIACWDADSVHSSDYQSIDMENKGLVDRESHYGKSSKCTVVIVDSYSLTIVQTVFHGNLSIGPLKSMSILLYAGHMDNHSVMMVDSFSKVQCLPILKDSEATGANFPANSSHLVLKDWLDGSEEGEALMACANQGQLLVLIYSTHCTFRLVDDGNKIGEILFLDYQLYLKGQSHVIGGMFLEDDQTSIRLNFGKHDDVISEELAVWNSRGSAAVYRVSYSSSTFAFEPLLDIPAVSRAPNLKLSISFVYVSCYLLRIESICLRDEEPLLWEPYMTIWLLPQQYHSKELSGGCKRLSEGQCFDDWISKSIHKTEGSIKEISSSAIGLQGEAESLHTGASCSKISEKYVSSSMVISENWCLPMALVYGFCNGDIEVVWFDMCFEGSGSYGQNQHNEANLHGSRQYLSGHTGAVLCLAAHQMVSMPKGRDFSHVLVSGSMDCTIRIWDLDSGNMIIVMHQHVAPVRQIILPPPLTECPWNDCFLSVAEDCCVALTSLGTLQVERMFPGQPYYPTKIVWDSARGYVACLCPNHTGILDTSDVLFIWDIKTGARERVLRGAAAHSMLDHFCTVMKKDSAPASLMCRNTSASSLNLPLTEENKYSHSRLRYTAKGTSTSSRFPVSTSVTESNRSQTHATKEAVIESIESTVSAFQSNKPPIEGLCPFPGITALCFDLKSMISICKSHDLTMAGSIDHRKTSSEVIGEDTPKDSPQKKIDSQRMYRETDIATPHHVSKEIYSASSGTSGGTVADHDLLYSLEESLLQFSLSLLHLWNVDYELDRLLQTEMKLKRPELFNVASGLIGDRGSLTLMFPGSSATLELWRSSSEYSALRSLTMLALAQHMISLSPSYSGASSALAAFYARSFAEKIPDIKPPLLQLLVSFWQDEFEHVKMAARSLFHCAASRAIPRPLCCNSANAPAKSLDRSTGITKLERENSNSLTPNCLPKTLMDSRSEESEILSWLESFDTQDWISCVGGTTQDAMTSHIIVAAALAVWYPSLVKPNLALLTVQSLMKLVMAMNEKYSSTAAEILAEGMESTWKACIGSEIPRLIADIFFQIECVSGASANAPAQKSALSHNIKEILVAVLLPSLAMADVLGFLNVIQSQVWSTASDSPVHVVSLMTLIRVVRGCPRNLAQYLDKVVTFILQTMDPSNSVLRRSCTQSSMAALKELVRVFPMVALNDTATRLAVGDAIAEIKNASIRVYDMQSMAKIKVLDASGPLGLPTLLRGASDTAVTTAISALSFALDGEGLVAFSENGLMIRWWSLGSVWWEKISRNLTPVQCTKVIFVPPWEGFSPNSSRSSIMASVTSNDGQVNLQESKKASTEIDSVKLLVHHLDLSYRLEWVGERKVKLMQHGRELGIFQL